MGWLQRIRDYYGPCRHIKYKPYTLYHVQDLSGRVLITNVAEEFHRVFGFTLLKTEQRCRQCLKIVSNVMDTSEDTSENTDD